MSTKSGFNECKSIRFKGLERASHSRGQKFDQQSHKKMSTNPLKPVGLQEVHLSNTRFQNGEWRWQPQRTSYIGHEIRCERRTILMKWRSVISGESEAINE